MLRSHRWYFWPVAAVVLLADCASKRAIEEALPAAGMSKPVIDDVLRFTLAYNQGAAFSSYFGPYQRWVLVAVVVTILVMLFRNRHRIPVHGGLGTVGLALIVGGAFGNLLDRLISPRGVVDFIDVGFGTWRFFFFNLADAGVFLGGSLLAYVFWRAAPAPAPNMEGR